MDLSFIHDPVLISSNKGVNATPLLLFIDPSFIANIFIKNSLYIFKLFIFYFLLTKSPPLKQLSRNFTSVTVFLERCDHMSMYPREGTDDRYHQSPSLRPNDLFGLLTKIWMTQTPIVHPSLDDNW